MRGSYTRVAIVAPAAMLILVGVASVAFSLGASSGSAPNARFAQSTSAPGNPRSPGAPGNPRSPGAPGNPRSPGAPGNPRPGPIAPVSGTVAGKTTTSIVQRTTAGKMVTVNVSSATRYLVSGMSNATLANIAVRSRVSVQGTPNADGSINATIVSTVGTGRGFRGGRRGSSTPSPSAAPSGASV